MEETIRFQCRIQWKNFQCDWICCNHESGKFPNAGFALFRQDRVVIGGTDSNYKPSQIFGQAQSQRSLKLFGELNMDDFPVNQAKDGFIWDDGLEDAFIEKLKTNIQEYIEIAELSKKSEKVKNSFPKKNQKNYIKPSSQQLLVWRVK